MRASDCPTPRGVRATVTALAARLAPRQLRVQLVLADNALLRRLNREFRGKNRATDVLSFRYDEPRLERGGGRAARAVDDSVDAELYISLERARQQAAERGIPLGREVVLLALHGLLHLQGHDHHEPGEARRMQEAERAQLRWLERHWGWPPQQPLVSV